MASWHPILMEWAGDVPDDRHLAAINNGLKSLDYDCPTLGKHGMEAMWRSPLGGVDLQVVVNAITRAGFPIKSQWADQDSWGEPRDNGKWVVPDESPLDGVAAYHEFMRSYLWHLDYAGSPVHP